MRPPWTSSLDKFVLAITKIGGRLLGRPSEQLLTSLASQDRGSMATMTAESPMVLAAHHIQLGQSAFKSGAYGEALHHFGVAIEHSPDAPWAWHGRGDALQLSGQHEAALNAYQQACNLDNKCGLHLAGKANVLRSIGRIEESDTAWEDALSLDPSLTWMRDGSQEG
jgi:tetratricopeptide (TPR) repeat protein